MRLPNQSKPVARSVSTRSNADGVAPSGDGIACTICMAGCNQLGGIAKQLCQMACNSTVC